MIYHVHYSSPRDVTNPGYDGKMLAFPLSYVSGEFAGAPEEKKETKEIRIDVPIDGTTLAVWKLSEEELVRVLFEFARRFLKDALAKNTSFAAHVVQAPLVSVHKTPGSCPFDPVRVPSPDGFSEQVEIRKHMGFGAR